MRGRIIPFRISFSASQHTAVPHIDRNQDKLSVMGRNRTLAKDHFLRINIIVDGVEGTKCGHPGLFQNDFRHSFTAAPCKLLTDLYIVEVVIQVGAVQIAKICRNRRLFCCQFLLHCLQCGLNLSSAALLLICFWDNTLYRNSRLISLGNQAAVYRIFIFGTKSDHPHGDNVCAAVDCA